MKGTRQTVLCCVFPNSTIHSDRPLALIISHRSGSQMSSRDRQKARADDNKRRLGDDSVGKFGTVTSSLQRLKLGKSEEMWLWLKWFCVI